MSLAFAVESIAQSWPEFETLASIHWQEARDRRGNTEPFLLVRQRYESANETGFLRFLTAREDGRLVGYLVLYVTASMHSQIPLAVEDTFFLHPDYRRGRNALRFLQFMESQCRGWGVQKLLCSCETTNETGIVGLLTRLLDFRPAIMQYVKDLSTRADSAHLAPYEVPDVRSIPTRTA
jgi:GNAT superfamily N-acetyltransferase